MTDPGLVAGIVFAILIPIAILMLIYIQWRTPKPKHLYAQMQMDDHDRRRKRKHRRVREHPHHHHHSHSRRRRHRHHRRRDHRDDYEYEFSPLQRPDRVEHKKSKTRRGHNDIDQDDGWEDCRVVGGPWGGQELYRTHAKGDKGSVWFVKDWVGRQQEMGNWV